MKNLLFILAAVGFLFVSDLSYGAGPLENEGHKKGVTPLDDAGTLSGQVINLDRAEGVLEIRTTDKGVTRIQLDKDHAGVMDQLKNVRPGDKVMITLTTKAIDVKKNGRTETGDSTAPQEGDFGGSETAPPAATGKLTGQVVGLDRSEKSLDIRLNGGGITHLHLGEEANEAWREIKPGDRIEVTLTMEGTSIEPKTPG